jgi:hypothetical protein
MRELGHAGILRIYAGSILVAQNTNVHSHPGGNPGSSMCSIIVAGIDLSTTRWLLAVSINPIPIPRRCCWCTSSTSGDRGHMSLLVAPHARSTRRQSHSSTVRLIDSPTRKLRHLRHFTGLVTCAVAQQLQKYFMSVLYLCVPQNSENWNC